MSLAAEKSSATTMAGLFGRLSWWLAGRRAEEARRKLVEWLQRNLSAACCRLFDAALTEVSTATPVVASSKTVCLTFITRDANWAAKMASVSIVELINSVRGLQLELDRRYRWKWKQN